MFFQLVSLLIILNLSIHVESIIDGEEVTEPHKFPWIVGVHIGYGYCGGSIISENVIMTAAHCVVDIPKSKITVAIGHSNLTSNQIKRFKVEQIVIHPKYEFVTNDIALLRLSENLAFDDSVQPISLPEIQGDF